MPVDICALVAGKRDEIPAVADRHGATNVRALGTVARRGAGPESDLDLLVTFGPVASLLDLIGLAQELSDRLGSPLRSPPTAGSGKGSARP